MPQLVGIGGHHKGIPHFPFFRFHGRPREDFLIHISYGFNHLRVGLLRKCFHLVPCALGEARMAFRIGLFKRRQGFQLFTTDPSNGSCAADILPIVHVREDILR